MKIKRLLLLTVVALWLPLVTAQAESKVEADNDCALSTSAYDYLTPQKVIQVQDALAYLGLYNLRMDGIAGPATLGGLTTYCIRHGLKVDARLSSRESLVHELMRDASISHIYPDWRTIIKSQRFITWLTKQEDAPALHDEILKGTSAQVVRILAQYTKERPSLLMEQNALFDKRTMFYSLSAKDLSALVARRDAVTKLKKISGAGFQAKDLFVKKVASLLKGNPVAATMLSLTEKVATQQKLVSLTSQGLNQLKAEHIPDVLVCRLSQAVSPGYTSMSEARRAIYRLLANTGANAASCPEGKTASNNSSKTTSKTTSKVAPNIVAKTAAQPAPHYYHQWAPMIMSQLQEQDAYRLTVADWKTLERSAGIVPDFYPTMLKNIQGVNYPLSWLFLAAARNTVYKSLDNYERKFIDMINTAKINQINSSFLSALNKNGIPPTITNHFQILKGHSFRSTYALTLDVTQWFNTEHKSFYQYQKSLDDQALKETLFNPKNKVTWTAAHGSRFFPAHKDAVVYGFYPYWMTSKTQNVYFDGLSRIGYYGVGFNNNGQIQPSGWQKNDSGAFALARQYRTKIDLIVTKRDWSSWKAQNPQVRNASLKTLANNLVSLLNLHPDDNLSGLAYYSRLGFLHSSLGNGVTIFFEHYPIGSEFNKEFDTFIKILAGKMNSGQTLNLMMPRRALGAQGPFAYEQLAKMMKRFDATSKRMMFLVLLDEPNINGEKLLRQSIEVNLHGTVRRDLLRSIVPVVIPVQNDHIYNEVIYASDNFGGIGFWPLPVGPIGKRIANAVQKEFYPKSSGWAATLASFIGLNRWYIRIAFFFFVLISLATLGLYLIVCSSRALLQKYFILILAGTAVPVVLLGMALLGYDPILATISKGNIPLFLVLLAIIIYAIWNYAQKRHKIP